jgi:hypothetical protein
MLSSSKSSYSASRSSRLVSMLSPSTSSFIILKRDLKEEHVLPLSGFLFPVVNFYVGRGFCDHGSIG